MNNTFTNVLMGLLAILLIWQSWVDFRKDSVVNNTPGVSILIPDTTWWDDGNYKCGEWVKE